MPGQRCRQLYNEIGGLIYRLRRAGTVCPRGSTTVLKIQINFAQSTRRLLVWCCVVGERLLRSDWFVLVDGSAMCRVVMCLDVMRRNCTLKGVGVCGDFYLRPVRGHCFSENAGLQVPKFDSLLWAVRQIFGACNTPNYVHTFVCLMFFCVLVC